MEWKHDDLVHPRSAFCNVPRLLDDLDLLTAFLFFRLVMSSTTSLPTALVARKGRLFGRRVYTFCVSSRCGGAVSSVRPLLRRVDP